jgi:phosphatidylglycerophosphate synthase
VQAVIFVPDAGAGCRDGTPGGLALLERQLKQLRALDHGPATLVVPEAVILPPLPDALVAARCRVPAGDDPFAALAAAAPALPARFLFLAADWLVDARVLRAAAVMDDTLMRDGDGRVAPVGCLTSATVERLGATLPASVPTMSLDALDPYAPELRGNVPPYLLRVRSATDRRLAWRVLLDHVQKRGLDLPGQYFDSPFENALVRALAVTRVTPNQITLATLVLAGVVGVLFLRGSLALGLVLALVVGVLDGVDGKLARLKLATSRLGELEHVGDFVYENFWYVALALHLSATTGMVGFWRAGMAIVACDLVDSLFYGAVQARTGRFLDELSPFDRGFRTIAGRRNVYVWILVAGVCMRRPAGAFLTVTGWAAITASIHGARAAVWTWRGADAAAAAPQVSEIEPVAGAPVSEK